MPSGEQIGLASACRDLEWATHSAVLAWHAQVYSYRHLLYSSGYISIISIVIVFLMVVVVVVVVVVAFVIVVTVLPQPAATWNGRRIPRCPLGTHRYIAIGIYYTAVVISPS